ERSKSYKIMLLLALAQAIAGLLRAFNWVHIGMDLFGQGILLVPFVGAVAIMHGFFISLVALLYLLFVIGTLLDRSWAWWSCMTAVIINLFLVLSALGLGASVVEGIVWSIIPVVLIAYLFSQKGGEALKGAQQAG